MFQYGADCLHYLPVKTGLFIEEYA